MPLEHSTRRRQIILNVSPYVYDVDAVALSLINQFKADGADPEITKLDEYKLSLTFREHDGLTYEIACQKILWSQYVQNIEQKNIAQGIEVLKRMLDPYFDSPVVANVNEVKGDGRGQLDGISSSAFSDGEVMWANGKPIPHTEYNIDDGIRPEGPPLKVRDINKAVQPSTITSSWKTAHEGDHPNIEHWKDLQLHLVNHHSGDFIGDMDDHEHFHCDPDDYNMFNKTILGFPMKGERPDHYHTDDYERSNIPDSLPKSFASKKIATCSSSHCEHDKEIQDLTNILYNRLQKNLNSGLYIRKLMGVHAESVKWHKAQKQYHLDMAKEFSSADQKRPNIINEHTKEADLHNQAITDHSRAYINLSDQLKGPEGIFEASIKTADPGSLRGEGVSGMIDPDEEVVGAQDLDSNATEVDEFPKSVGVFKNSSWKTATSSCPNCPHGGIIDDLTEKVARSLEQRDAAQDLSTFHAFREVNRKAIGDLADAHDDAGDVHMDSSESYKLHPGRDIDESNPQHILARQHYEAAHNLRSQYTSVEPFMAPKKSSIRVSNSLKTAAPSEFGNPLNENANKMQSLEAPGLEIRTPLDTGKRNYSEQRLDANPLTLRSLFTGDDVNGPWPHTKNLSGPLDFEPTDNQNEDSTGPITGSLNEDNGTYTPPEEEEPEQYPVLDKIRERKSFTQRYVHRAEHLPINSSWHQSFVETFDTNPDEETPDTLLNPADELKNGRPRSTDSPQQSAQLLPGMLIDHDQMGGSGTASGSF